MNGSDVRKFIKQGEQATEVLEKLGYTYSAKAGEHPHWVAPVDVLDPIKEALLKIVAEATETQVKEFKEAQRDDPQGPNWHLIKDMVGRNFKVRAENIPESNVLRGYSAGPHFFGKLFRALEIKYRRSDEYTGYAVLFSFKLRPFNEEVVWLPLSACAFQS
ncbi:hypothetical protein 10P302A_gene0026 [Pseudomonas phage 10P302A]|uniref:Uncharacterized protein n=1 Tax=Pseudomonas phage 10P302A TaxID=3038233 RepID=A0AAF0K8I5_9CAUD|nr:hypothetical protein 10P302A_gene0026 [Pseudomonas phage 10P302A]